MNHLNWLAIGLIGVAGVAFALSTTDSSSLNPGSVQAQSNSSEFGVQVSELGVNSSTPNSRKRHKITLSLTSMDDLKVKEKDRIKEGDIISDRTSDRQRLEAKKKQLEIAIAQLSLPLSQLAPLPEPNLEQERVALKQAQLELEMATKALENKADTPFRQDWLSEALEPEKVKEQAALKERQIKAAVQVEAALARMSEAKTNYQQEQYQHSIQLAAHQTNLQKQQYEMASLTSQLQEVEEKLGELVAVRSPYSGRVRRVKVLGQNERKIAVEVTLDVRKK